MKMKLKKRSTLFHVLSIATVLLLSGALPVMADDRSLDEGILPFYYGVSNYYEAPKDEVLAVQSRLAPEEVPVAFHIATRAGVSPIEVAEARAAGHGWVEVGQRYGVGPAAFHVPMERAPGPPYGNAWGYYRNKPQHEWNTIRLTDREVIDLVNLRFLSEHYGLDRHDIAHRRSLGHGHDRIVHDVWKGDFQRHDPTKDRVTDHWYPDGHGRDRRPHDTRPDDGHRDHGHVRDDHRRDRDGDEHARDGRRNGPPADDDDGRRGGGKDDDGGFPVH